MVERTAPTPPAPHGQIAWQSQVAAPMMRRTFPLLRHEQSMSMRYSVSIDVPLLDEGLRFYRDALGLSEIARPMAKYVILKCGDSQIGLIEKSAGSKPAREPTKFAAMSDTGRQFISTFRSTILKPFWQRQ